MFVLVVSKILRPLVNTLTRDDKYSFSEKGENLKKPIQMQLSKTLKTFSPILLHFLNLHLILIILKKKMSFIAYVFWKL